MPTTNAHTHAQMYTQQTSTTTNRRCARPNCTRVDHTVPNNRPNTTSHHGHGYTNVDQFFRLSCTQICKHTYTHAYYYLYKPTYSTAARGHSRQFLPSAGDDLEHVFALHLAQQLVNVGLLSLYPDCKHGSKAVRQDASGR